MRLRVFSPADGILAGLLLLVLVIVTLRGPVTVDEGSGFPIRSEAEADLLLPRQVIPSSETLRLNLNLATAERLASLPGIGPVLAEAIVRFRETHGPFKRLQDLQDVPGIGRRRMQGVLTHLTLGEEAAWSTK